MKWLSKKIISISVFCCFFLLANSALYAESSNQAYESGYDEGWYDGVKFAEKDIDDNNKKSYSKAIPSNSEITERYDLDDEGSSYRMKFLDGYEDGFKEGYNNTFDEYDEDDTEKDSLNYAESLGLVMGKSYGYMDYYNGDSNDWEEALPSNSTIIDIFDLKKETKEYRNNYIDIFKDKFLEGYKDGYDEAKFSPFLASYDQGNIDGAYFGNLLGDIYGKRDYYLGYTFDHERNLSAMGKISKAFRLTKDSDEYLDSFISSFNYAFEKSYAEAFRNSNKLIYSITYENGYDNGREIGIKRGESFAKIDMILRQPVNNYKYIANENDIINDFHLDLEEEEYKEGFISGYNEGLTEGYISQYQKLSYSSLITELETKIIPISGGDIFTTDKRIRIEVDKGTYFNDVVLSIEGINNMYKELSLSNNQLIKASEVYTIKVSNPSQYYDDTKPIKLEFEYYGPQNAGIYKYVNNEWVYLPSKISDDKITTYLKPSSLSDSSKIYAVYIDKNAKHIIDIRGHWAKEEILAYINRGIAELFNDSTFRPNSQITRGELLVLLSKVYNWELNNLDEKIDEIKNIEDYESFGEYNYLVAYALKQGYMGLYSDNTFKINNTISYNQLNNIMRKVTGVDSFNWQNTAYYMMMDKDTRSKSYDSMNNYVTRAEVIYMLYLINEWKY